MFAYDNNNNKAMSECDAVGSMGFNDFKDTQLMSYVVRTFCSFAFALQMSFFLRIGN